MSLRASTLGIGAGALAIAGCSSTDSCFVRGTLVATPAGPTPIDSLRVGDEVLSYSLHEERATPQAVLAIHRAFVREVRRVEIDGGIAIRGVTPNHPIYSMEAEEFLPAGRLIEGSDVAVSRDGDAPALARVSRVTATEHPGPTVEVWNLSVDGPDQTYFADGVLVHNKTVPAPSCATDHVKIELSAVDGPAGKYEVRVTVTDPQGGGASNFTVDEGGATLCDKPVATAANTWACALSPLAKGKHDAHVYGSADTKSEYCALERTLPLEVK